MKIGSILYIKEENKTRPYVLLKNFKNPAGIIYNILVVPITTKETVGGDNLIKLNSESLRSPSYAKMNNLTTLNIKGISYRVDGQVSDDDLALIFDKLLNILKNE